MAKAELNLDQADKYTDEELDSIVSRLDYIYRKAYKEMKEKRDKSFSSFLKADKEKQKLVESGEWTEEQWRQWRLGWIHNDNKMSSLINDYARKATEANQTASEYINSKTPEIFAYNHNYTAYEFEKNTGIAFSIVDKNVVKELATGKNHVEFRTLSVNKKATYNWNKEKITRDLTAGIIQGKSISDIAKDFYKTMGSNKKASVRNARTAVTSAQNGGRMQGLYQAKDMGIDVQKKWISAHDDRVRDSHRELDGETVDVDKPFSNGLMYPSDPKGEPSEVYNCRCTMRGVVGKAKRSVETSKLTFKQYIESKMKDGLVISSNKAKDDPERYNNIVSNINELGFIPKVSLRNLDLEMLDNSVQQITKLDNRFNVLSKCKNIVMSGKNDEEKPYARAFVKYKGSGVDGWGLHLCENAFSKPKNRYVKFIGKLVGKGEFMPCSEEDFINYEVTHEYGHIIENMYIQTRYYDNGYDTPLDELYDLVKEEIIGIAKRRNPKFEEKNSISKYGKGNSADFFAEAFANSQLGKPNELGDAILEWLKEKKI